MNTNGISQVLDHAKTVGKTIANEAVDELQRVEEEIATLQQAARELRLIARRFGEVEQPTKKSNNHKARNTKNHCSPGKVQRTAALVLEHFPTERFTLTEFAETVGNTPDNWRVALGELRARQLLRYTGKVGNAKTFAVMDRNGMEEFTNA